MFNKSATHSNHAHSQETQPLLPASEAASSGSTDHDTASTPPQPRRGEVTPLPKMQLFVLCLMRMTEPISYTVVFPFVNQMIHSNLPSVPVSEIGYYAGLVESCFAAVQFCTILSWGRISDTYGRKPVLLFGLFGTFVSVNCFGLSKSFAGMVVSRSIAGLMNGNIAVLKSTLAEITDETNQARAFSLIPICFAVGSILGTSLGGYLANPTKQFDWLKNNTFLQDHPFYLPCATASFFNLLAIILGALVLKETLPRKKSLPLLHPTKPSTSSSSSSTSLTTDAQLESNQPHHQTPQEAEPKPPLRSLLTPAIRRVLGTQFCLNFMNACHSALLPLFCYESVANGGLGFSNRDIAHILAVNGMFTILVQLVFFPKLERRLGSPIKVYTRVTFFLPFVWIFIPLSHYLARWSSPSVPDLNSDRDGAEAANYNKFLPILALVLAIVCKGISNMSIVCSNLLVNNSAPTKSSLGSLNGFSQMFGSLSRTIGPSFSTSLFAFSTSKHILDGQFSWIIMWGISFFTWWLTIHVKAPEKAPWRNANPQQEQEDTHNPDQAHSINAATQTPAQASDRVPRPHQP